jgi:hypothetical protein
MPCFPETEPSRCTTNNSVQHFNTVNHDILIAKLEYYGIVGRTRELIKSYLSNRYQRVTIKSSHAFQIIL